MSFATLPEMPIISEQQVAKVNKDLNTLVRFGELTDSGKQWLIIATDPWHDTAVQGVLGLPDQETGLSVIRQCTQEVSIKKNPILAAGNWGVRINNNPWIGKIQMTGSSIGGQNIIQANSALNAQVNGSVDICYNNDGDPTFLNVAETINPPEAFLKGNTRVIAMGLEVVNTTAVIDRQGLCTVARYTQPDGLDFTGRMVMKGAAPYTNQTSYLSLYPVRPPPNNLSEAILLPQFAQWEASDGSYQIVMLKTDRMVGMPIPTYPLMTEVDYGVAYVAPITTGSFSPWLASATEPGNTTVLYNPPCVVLKSPQDSVVAFYTGLSDKTTLTLRVRYILETFPSENQTDIITLATNTAKYDPMALQIYSKWQSSVPAGVTFHENPDGEWFKRAIGEIGKFVAPMVEGLPFPGAKLVGGAIKAGSNMLLTPQDNWETKPQRKKKNAKKRGVRQKARVIPPAPRIKLGPQPVPRRMVVKSK